MTRYLLFVAVLFTSGLLGAQDQTARFEREQKNSDNDYIIISLQQEGLALVRDIDKYKEGKQHWEAIRLDTTLQQVWQIEMDIENRFRLVGYDYRDKLIYRGRRQQAQRGDRREGRSGRVVRSRVGHRWSRRCETHLSCS